MSWLAIAVDDGPWGKVEDTPPSRVLLHLSRRRPADPLDAAQNVQYIPVPRERERIQSTAHANLCATHRVRCHQGRTLVPIVDLFQPFKEMIGRGARQQIVV